MRYRSALAVAVAVFPLSLTGCGSDADSPDDPAEVETPADVDTLPEGDFVDPALVDDDEDPFDVEDGPGEAPPEGD